jgi:hypothetical protein
VRSRPRNSSARSSCAPQPFLEQLVSALRSLR